MNIAITAEPIRWIGNRLSMKQATKAIKMDSKIPGNSFKTFISYLLYVIASIDYM